MKTTLILGLILAAATCCAAPADITLRDGTVLENAVIVRLSPATYIVQTDDALFELSEDELKPTSLLEHDFHDSRAPLITNHYDEIHVDGTATRYWTLPLNNRGKKALTEIRMGLAFWERAMVDQRTFVDERGTPLVSAYDPPRQKWASKPDKIIRQTLALDVPLAPGESTTFTGSETSSIIRDTEEGLVYQYHGDFSEDRLVWLKVRLPQGAKIQRISPAASVRFTHEECEYLMWRRYYKKGEVYPFEVVYTLD